MKKVILMLIILSLMLIMVLNTFAAEIETKLNSVLTEAVEFNGNYYLFVNVSCTWEQAKTYCEGLGGHLATITSQEEDDICFQLFKEAESNGCWLGGTDAKLEGIWTWVTDEPWNYSNWGESEPNGGTSENCLNYYGNYSDGRWNDATVDDSFPFICEWEKDNVEYVRNTFGYVTSSGMIYNQAFYFNGHIYKVFEYDMSYDEAKTYCEQLGGHLATITSKKEDKALYTYICKIGNFDCILGGSDANIEGLWEWVTGEAFSYANWNDGEPNDDGGEDYLQYASNGRWNDIRWKNCFLCEWDNCCILPDGSITEHLFGDSQTIKSATCTSKGQIKKVCTGCGAEVITEVELLPHDYDGWCVTTEATCHSEGESTRKCLNCGKMEVQTIASLTHQWSEWNISMPATCNTSGLNERNCILCGEKEQRVIGQLSHEYGDYIKVSGSKLIPPIVSEKTCNLCGDVQTYKDWSNVWIAVVIAITAIGVVIGVVNYVRAFRRR